MKRQLSDTGPRVLVVGAGIGGLCLAQGLRRAAVDVTVFDRDASAIPEHQGYGFSINHDGDAALAGCLPERLYELYRATAGVLPNGDFTLFTAQMQVVFRKSLPTTTGVAVNRQTLREVLLAELGDRVRFGRTFTGYEIRPDGLVDAHFTEGPPQTGHLLVGADGADSAVRAQLVPDAQFDDFGRSLYGKTPVTDQLRAIVPPEFFTGMPRVKDSRGLTLGIGAFVPTEPFAEAAARLAPDLQLTPVPDYLRWTLSLRGLSVTGEDARTVHGADHHRIATDLVAEWHPALRAVVEQADPAATFGFEIWCARPVAPWDEPAVTLLGDAIHTMTPGRGEGANTSLRDAALLTSVLTEAAAAETSLTAAKQRYETAMLDYGFRKAADSTRPFFAEAMRRI
jgi:2-polyprenyl-6-methoxyphenol hydroxylase-like FAD-dependent oxidoreductase